MKPLRFIGSSEDDLASFPREVKQAAGFQLFRVQAPDACRLEADAECGGWRL